MFTRGANRQEEYFCLLAVSELRGTLSEKIFVFGEDFTETFGTNKELQWYNNTATGAELKKSGFKLTYKEVLHLLLRHTSNTSPPLISEPGNTHKHVAHEKILEIKKKR